MRAGVMDTTAGFDIWANIPRYNSRSPSNKVDSVSVQCIGGFIEKCFMCSRINIATLHATRTNHCPRCGEAAFQRIPLAAHFACPARIERQFIVPQGFDVVQFVNERLQDFDPETSRLLFGFGDIEAFRLRCPGQSRWQNWITRAEKSEESSKLLMKRGVGEPKIIARAGRRYCWPLLESSSSHGMMALGRDRVVWYSVKKSGRGKCYCYDIIGSAPLVHVDVGMLKSCKGVGIAARGGLFINIVFASRLIAETWFHALSNAASEAAKRSPDIWKLGDMRGEGDALLLKLKLSGLT